MCSDNPNLPKEANKAKCFVIACFVFSVFSMIGFAGGTPGIVGAICGLLACVASSILLCCAPKSIEEGGGKFMAAGVLLLIAGVTQLIMGIIVIVFMITKLNEVGDHKYCNDRYSSNCDIDTSGRSCKNDWFYEDSVCYKNDPSDTTNSCDTQASWDACKTIHKDVVTAVVVILLGIASFFLFIAGILNTIGGAYCLKAKAAIQAKPMAVPVQGRVV